MKSLFLVFVGATFGVLAGFAAGEKHGAQSHSACWREMSDRPLAERVTQCGHVAAKEWKQTKKGWTQ